MNLRLEAGRLVIRFRSLVFDSVTKSLDSRSSISGALMDSTERLRHDMAPYFNVNRAGT
jgi:hypothetical protein